jgi:hypothetical protein
MLRKMLLLLALSTASLGCLDDAPEDETPQKSGEDDPDFVPPRPEEEPDDCGPSLQDSEDETCAPPRP